MERSNKKANHFSILENFLTLNSYIRITMENAHFPVIQIIEKDENEKDVVVAQSDRRKSASLKIIDLCHEISIQLNKGDTLSPEYYETTARRTLDNVVNSFYDISFYRLMSNRVVGIITKKFKGERYEVFTAIDDNIQSAFDSLDWDVYNKFGFNPNSSLETNDTLNNYTARHIANYVKRKRKK